MAQQVKLAASARTGRGKGPARRLRHEGRVPAVVYGRGVEATPVSVDALELYHVLHGPAGLNALIRLVVDGDEHLTIARELHRHPVRGDILHVDFYAVDRDRPIHVDVPIHLTGQDDIEAGGVVAQVRYSLPLRVKPLEVPDHLELDIAGMQVGDVTRVADLRLPADAHSELDADEPVVSVTIPTVVEEPEEEVPVLAELPPEELAALPEEERARLEAAAEAAAEAAEGEVEGEAAPPDEAGEGEGE